MKNQFSEFYFSRYREISSKIGSYKYKNDHISNTKNLKIDCSFVSVHSASFMQIWTLLNTFFSLLIWWFNLIFLMHTKDWRDFCEPDSDANQFRLGSPKKKHSGSRGAATVEGNFSSSNFSFQNCSNWHERCGMYWDEWKINFPIFATCSFWDMVDFVLKFRRKKIMLRWLRLPKPHVFFGGFASCTPTGDPPPRPRILLD